MLRELPPQVSIFLHFFTSMFQRSEGSPSDVPPTKDKVGFDNFPTEMKGHALENLALENLGYEQMVQLDSLSKGRNSTSGHKGNGRKLPPLTFLPPNCVPDPDLFKQFLFCADDGLEYTHFSQSPHEERLILFNPLTEQWKELPPLLHRRNPVLMHMNVDQSSKSYHKLAADSSASAEESLSGIAELYDSRTVSWVQALGDRYNLEEGIWSTKWSAEALPTSTILQLVENNDQLFSFSEAHNVRLIEWTPSEGDSEENTDTFTLVNVLKKNKIGGRSLEVYPEFALVPFSESQLCIYNTVDHSGEVYDIADQEKSEALPALREGFRVLIGFPHRNSLDHSRSNFLGFTVLHETTQASMSSAPSFENLTSNPGRNFWCSTLRVFGFLTCLSVAGASPASAPGPSTSQMSSTYPTFFYVGVGATIIGTAIGVISLGVSLYNHRRERGDSVRGVLDVLTRPFRERQRGMCILVGSLKVGQASLDDLRLELPV